MIGIIQSNLGSTGDQRSVCVIFWVIYTALQLLLLHDMCYIFWGVSYMVMPCCFVELNVAFLRGDISGWSDCAFRIMLVAFYGIPLQKAPPFQSLLIGLFSGKVPDKAANASLSGALLTEQVCLCALPLSTTHITANILQLVDAGTGGHGAAPALSHTGIAVIRCVLICRISDEELDNDPAANLLTSASEEAQKVARNEGKVRVA